MKRYDTIYADPPWPVKKTRRACRPNQVDMDYPTMSVEDISNLRVADIVSQDVTLWLWTTHAFLPEAFGVMDSWGFRYQRTITWDKANGMRLFGFHHRTEFLLFGYSGKLPMYPKRKAFPTCISAKSNRHSHKPHIFRELIEPFGHTRIELFARENAEGWDAWGNDPNICSVDICKHICTSGCAL